MKTMKVLILGIMLSFTLFSCSKKNNPEPQVPIPEFTYTPVSPLAGDEVKFRLEPQPGSSNIVSFKWTFGNAGTSTVRHPAFTFPDEGSYEVKVEVKDLAGQTASITKTVVIGKPLVLEFPATLAWTFENNTTISSKNDATAPLIDDQGVIYYVETEGNPAATSKMVAVIDGGTTATKNWDNSYGNFLRNTPSMGADGSIFIGKWSSNSITKINSANGSMLWEKATNGAGASNSTAAIDNGGNIYFASRITASAGGVYSFASDGTKRWEIVNATQGATYSSPAISKDGKTVYFYRTGSGALAALNTADGASKWASPVTGSTGVGTSLSINSDGTIYATTDTEVLAFTDNGTTGTVKWKVSVLGANSSGVVIGNNGDLYVGSKEGLVAINPTNGNVKWKYAAFMEECVPAVDKNGNIYFGDTSGKFYIVNAAGELQKQFSLGTSNAVVHTPTIHDNGNVYVEVSESTKVKLCKIAVENSGPSLSAWPMKGQNRKHTGLAK